MQVLVIDAGMIPIRGCIECSGFDELPEPLIDFVGGKAAIEKEIEARIRLGIPGA